MADLETINICADGHNHPRGLVPQHHRRPHHKVPDGAMSPVVHVRPAYPDRVHLEEDLVRPGLGDGQLLQPDVVRAVQHRRQVIRITHLQ